MNLGSLLEMKLKVIEEGILPDVVKYSGLNEFHQMLVSHLNNNGRSPYTIDEGGRITDKRDGDNGEVYLKSNMAYLFSPHNDDRELIGGMRLLHEFTTGRINTHNMLQQIVEIYNNLDIDIPLYKILASCAVRYDSEVPFSKDYQYLSMGRYTTPICTHASQIDLKKYFKNTNEAGRRAAYTSIMLALPDHLCDYSETMCCFGEYSVFCDLRMMPYLVIKDNFKKLEDIIDEIENPEDYGVGIKLQEAVCELIAMNDRCKIDWINIKYQATSKTKSICENVNRKSLFIPKLTGDKNDDVEIRTLVQTIHEHSLVSSTHLLEERSCRKRFKSARK